ncbi:MAG TPA: hypothetical protein VGZ92_03995 [Bradyrhizobium sp.]|jgi:hypothetical protein|nr:hypothetical protein [Bradyrhizobium sp.]
MAQIIHVGRGSGDKRANVIFLHGFGGDLKGTWRHGLGDEFFWPRWLAEDVPGLAVYSLGHDPEQSRHCVQGAWRARKRHEAPRTGGHSPFARPLQERTRERVPRLHEETQENLAIVFEIMERRKNEADS